MSSPAPTSARSLRNRSFTPNDKTRVPPKFRRAPSPLTPASSSKKRSSVYRCTFCNHELTTSMNLAVHINSLHADCKCNECGETLAGAGKLGSYKYNTNFWSGPEMPTWQCNGYFISEEDNQWQQQHGHMNKRHKALVQEQPKKSTCVICGREVTTAYLTAHSLRFHILQPCLDCGDWYEGLVALEAHLETCEKGGKRYLSDHLLANIDGRIKQPKVRDDDDGAANVTTLEHADCHTAADRNEGAESNGEEDTRHPVHSPGAADSAGAELDEDAATLNAMSELGLSIPSDDNALDGMVVTSDPFLNVALGGLIGELFPNPLDRNGAVAEHPNMDPLPPLLPSLGRNSMLL